MLRPWAITARLKPALRHSTPWSAQWTVCQSPCRFAQSLTRKRVSTSNDGKPRDGVNGGQGAALTFGKGAQVDKERDIRWANRTLAKRLRNFENNVDVRRKSAAMGIKGVFFTELSRDFVNAAMAGQVPRCDGETLQSIWDDEDGLASVDRMLLNAFFHHIEPRLPVESKETFDALRKLSDLRFPHEWFPSARKLQRKIILHVGPTNSGKTYSALKRLSEAGSGIYCGPLRLLAHEIFDRMNAQGVPCNLVTGEERREIAPDARLTSSTIEMANLNKDLDVAVLDEIQMIGDRSRGWAWTQALLGLRAREIHLCGEPSAVPLVKKICEAFSDDVEVHEYERLTPLTISNKSLHGSWENVRKGDCVVAFSRREIFETKLEIEKATGLKCAVAYGSLPPETRALQAKLFNDPTSGFDMLVASDAIGMGLNLNIKRIIFSTVSKFDGQNHKGLVYPQLKQIAGRAGRFGTTFENGLVTTLRQTDISYVKRAMQSPIRYLETAGLQPTLEILELFAAQLPQDSFSSLLQKFEDLASLTGEYFLCNFQDQKRIADLIEPVPLSLRDRHLFVTAPVATKDPMCMDALLKMANAYSAGRTCKLADLVTLPRAPVLTTERLRSLESAHKVVIIYMWLSLRYPDSFITDQIESVATKTRCENLIDESLKFARYTSPDTKKSFRGQDMRTRGKRKKPSKDVKPSKSTLAKKPPSESAYP